MLDGQPPRPVGLDAPTVRHPGAAASTPRRPRSRTGPKSPDQIQALIHARLEMLDQGADHYTLLGVPTAATAKEIEVAYHTLARQLHPDRLRAAHVDDTERHAHRLFAQVNTAFAVLSDPTRRADYVAVLSRGGEAAVRAEQAKADEMAMRILDAEEAFRRGEAAMRRDQLGVAIEEMRRAIELNPDEADYHALLAWAQFCASSDKMVAAPSTRSTLDRAIRQSPNATTARMLLGRMERMLGRDQDALRHFQEVLQLDPHHAEATSEIRVLESRRAGPKRR
jgi:curved DNA-binding protein CbpA